MSHYFTRFCRVHGEWECDVDNPDEGCPECQKSPARPPDPCAAQAEQIIDAWQDSLNLKDCHVWQDSWYGFEKHLAAALRATADAARAACLKCEEQGLFRCFTCRQWFCEEHGTVHFHKRGPECVAFRERQVRELHYALSVARKTIKAWHGMETWKQYEQSPEMQAIDAALAIRAQAPVEEGP